LATQVVHPEDSVLAEVRDVSGKGLNTSYETLIKASFAPATGLAPANSASPADTGAAPYTQMEANFPLFLVWHYSFISKPWFPIKRLSTARAWPVFRKCRKV